LFDLEIQQCRFLLFVCSRKVLCYCYLVASLSSWPVVVMQMNDGRALVGQWWRPDAMLELYRERAGYMGHPIGGRER
jgi:hypothetical protein